MQCRRANACFDASLAKHICCSSLDCDFAKLNLARVFVPERDFGLKSPLNVRVELESALALQQKSMHADKLWALGRHSGITAVQLKCGLEPLAAFEPIGGLNWNRASFTWVVKSISPSAGGAHKAVGLRERAVKKILADVRYTDDLRSLTFFSFR